MIVACADSYPKFLKASGRLAAMACCAALALSIPARARQLVPQTAAATANSAAVAQTAPQKPPAKASPAGGITQEELKRLLVGKPLYLRGGYLDNVLGFDEHGRLIGHSAQGSYTLSAIQINKVSLSKHKVKVEGIRYGLHFVGQLANEDPAKALDRVRITPKKKVVKITIEREIVAKSKKKADRHAPPDAAATPAPLQVDAAHAAKALREALDQIFAQELDERMMAAMPDFWRLYYQAVAARADYRPTDTSVLRQNMVDQKARLLSKFEPDSNEFAQANGVAGMALYHTVVDVNGKAQEIAVGRPIGFGLDENAVEAIRKASFQPAMKNGKPVAVLLDLVVQFRIFSKRTAAAHAPEAAEGPTEALLPGPYSAPGP
jgi:TonB family protein